MQVGEMESTILVERNQVFQDLKEWGEEIGAQCVHVSPPDRGHSALFDALEHTSWYLGLPGWCSKPKEEAISSTRFERWESMLHHASLNIGRPCACMVLHAHSRSDGKRCLVVVPHLEEADGTDPARDPVFVLLMVNHGGERFSFCTFEFGEERLDVDTVPGIDSRLISAGLGWIVPQPLPSSAPLPWWMYLREKTGPDKWIESLVSDPKTRVGQSSIVALQTESGRMGLLRGAWLDDDTIDAFVEHMMTGWTVPSHAPWAVSTAWIRTLFHKWELGSLDVDGLIDDIRAKGERFGRDVAAAPILFPITKDFEDMHWVTAIYDPSVQETLIFDPYHSDGRIGRQQMRFLSAITSAHANRYTFRHRYSEDPLAALRASMQQIATQRDGHSCGVRVLMLIAHCIANGALPHMPIPAFTRNRVTHFRRILLAYLLGREPALMNEMRQKKHHIRKLRTLLEQALYQRQYPQILIGQLLRGYPRIRRKRRRVQRAQPLQPVMAKSDDVIEVLSD